MDKIKWICAAVMIAILVGTLWENYRQNNETPSYCIEEGCPRETLSDSNYCSYHKCHNLNCNNRRLTSNIDYCQECLDRAQTK